VIPFRPLQRWAFFAACAAAGALAVPPHAIATPVSAIIAGLFGFLGLRVWRWSCLPNSIRGEALSGVARLVRPAVWMGIGLVVGLLLLGAIRLAIEPAVPAIGARIAAAGAMPLSRRVIIIYVAAVGEELVFRLFLLSMVAGLAARLLRLPDRVPTPAVVWAANGLSAVAFAAVHLPSWSASVPLSAGLSLSVLSLNALGGVVLGHMFVNRGIVAAMWTHAGADCAIQLLGPLTG
jgi:Type II CAAX prenyl endopeptidase Rce1-like